MSLENQTVLNFAIQEAVWFQKGQEVAEIMSVQLTPDISINQEGEYVYVRGSLFLEGEYKPIFGAEDEFSLRDISPHRTVEDVVTREDGNNEFYHNFPVDISIPIARIEELEDIYVSVESFDYELQDQSNLKLIADIVIGGLKDESRQEKQEVEYDYSPVQTSIEIEETEDASEEVAFEPFRLEVKREPYVEARPIQQQWESLAAYSEPEVAVQPSNTTEYNPFIQPPSQQVSIPITPEPEVEPTRYSYYESQQHQQTEQDEGDSAEAYDEHYSKVDYVNQDENALYLTKFFSREEEDEFAQLRLYIVQQGDTIESIANHYGVKVESVMRANSLEDAYVNVGKTLYIPKGTKHHI